MLPLNIIIISLHPCTYPCHYGHLKISAILPFTPSALLSSSQPSAQKLLRSAWPIAPRPLSSDRNLYLLESMPSQHNLVLVLHLNTTHFPSSPGVEIPLTALLIQSLRYYFYLVNRLPILFSFHISSAYLLNHVLILSTTALCTTVSVRHTAHRSVVQYQRNPSTQPRRLSKTAYIVPSSTTIPPTVIRDIESV